MLDASTGSRAAPVATRPELAPRAGGAPAERRCWTAALGCFVVAGTAGVAFRLALVTGLPEALTFDHLRHAHSHLMFYGWATAALAVLIAARLRALGVADDTAALRRLAWAAIAAGVAAFGPFLLDGYGSTTVLGVSLPLSLAASSANALVWYGIAWCYWRATRRVPRTRPLRLWDSALALLVIGSLGPLGRGLATAVDAGAFWEHATVQAFLSLFADGWLLLGVLGLAWSRLPASPRAGRLGLRLVLAGLPVSFLLVVPVSLVPPPLRSLAAVGGVLLLVGLAVLGGALARAMVAERAWWWALPLGATAVRALAELPLLPVSLASWGQGAGLRVLVLHVLLVGAVSAGLWAAAVDAWGHAVERRLWPVWHLAIVLLLAGIVPASGLWPEALGGSWRLWAATAAGVPAVVVAAGPGLIELRRLQLMVPCRSGPSTLRGPTPSMTSSSNVDMAGDRQRVAGVDRRRRERADMAQIGSAGGGHRGIRRLATAAAAATLLLIALGGAVRATDSGLACPDWPACYGQWLPAWNVNIWLEHGHRLWAGAVGLMILALAVWAARHRRTQPGVALPAVSAFVLVLVQSALGAFVVLLLLRPVLVTAHLGSAAVILLLLLMVSVRAAGPPTGVLDHARLRRFASLSTAVAVLVFVQLLIGAQATGLAAVYVFDAWPIWLADTSPLEASTPREVFHLLHRGLGYVVAAAVVVLAVAARREDRRREELPAVPPQRWLTRLPDLAAALVVVQVALGIANVLTRAAVPFAIAHLTFAFLLFTTVALVALRARAEVRAAAAGAARTPAPPPVRRLTEEVRA